MELGEGERRRGERIVGKTGERNSRNCYNCGKVGHIAKDCRVKAQRGEDVGRKAQRGDDAGRSSKSLKKDLQDIECFNCHKTGHYSSKCPRNAFFCTERKVAHTGESTTIKRTRLTTAVNRSRTIRSRFVEGKPVDDIQLDTGCSRTLIYQSLVPDSKILEGDAVAIRCAHCDTVLYPLAKIALEVEGQNMVVEAGVSNSLPMSVLLGTDNPELLGILCEMDQGLKEDKAYAVTMRVEHQKQKDQEKMESSKMVDCSIQPHVLDDDEINGEMAGLEKLDDDLFQQSKEKRRKTKKEKRLENQKRMEFEVVEQEETEQKLPEKLEGKKGVIEKHDLDISTKEMKQLQAQDPTLRDVRISIEESEAQEGIGFFSKEGLLCRQWIPRRREGTKVEQLVLPKCCRSAVIQIAHSIPLGGHLDKTKTTDRILQRFYWPTMHRDIENFCKACAVCQKMSTKGVRKAPLRSLPIISQPFERIAMDVVGPLLKSSCGNRFILVICDYATRYPEAVPMRSVDAASVAEELMKLFSRVGVPKEILTDQGTKFTSLLLTELYRMLHVHPIKTTPYHPQTDGLVERFNRTLKTMLKKTVNKEGKDWDKLLPYLLFAYREVPQASIGFSPFDYSMDGKFADL